MIEQRRFIDDNENVDLFGFIKRVIKENDFDKIILN